jgi:uracil-DNA glycosylase family 4
LRTLDRAVTRCRDCERLVDWREEVARTKRAAYADDRYWGRGVPSFGPDDARVMAVGLAPAAHGANRTGRMFTGDRSGDWLYAALHATGFANQAASVARDDGLVLDGIRVTSIVHCAPPDNKPARTERDRCRPFFERELELLPSAHVLVALGGFAWDNILWALRQRGHVVRPKPKFGHAAEAEVGPYTVLASYHPSQQNTFTGRLTRPMLEGVFKRARALAYG